MQKGQATGVDTRTMIPVFCCIYLILAICFLPWFSVPEYKYAQLPVTYTLREAKSCLTYLEQEIHTGAAFPVGPVTEETAALLGKWSAAMEYAGGLLALLLAAGIFAVFRWKKKSSLYIRLVMGISSLLPVSAFFWVYVCNRDMNWAAGRESNFINLSIGSNMQLSSFAYGAFLLAVLMALTAGRLMDTDREEAMKRTGDRKAIKDRKLGKRTVVSFLLLFTAAPFLIFFGIFFLNDRSDVFISLCLIGVSLIPFFMVFEDRKPQAREILLISVMAAIAVVGRMAFFMLPQFKPVTAVVIITGISLGSEAGFLTGAMAAFVSNFFFGQGPWTPWQILAYGIIGFLAGLIFRGKRRRFRENRILLCLYGGAAALLIYGFLLDTSTVTMYSREFTWEAFRAVYISGFPFNVIHAVSTIVFLFFLTGPICRKLDRIKKKYGIMEP